MSFHPGKGSAFYIDDSGGSSNNISAFVTNVDMTFDVNVPETTVFGVNDRTYIVGLRGSTFSISGHFDETASTGPDAILHGIINLNTGVTQTFQYGPEGDTTGDVRYTGECFITSYAVTAPVDGVVDFSADFTVTGAVTRDLNAFV